MMHISTSLGISNVQRCRDRPARVGSLDASALQPVIVCDCRGKPKGRRRNYFLITLIADDTTFGPYFTAALPTIAATPRITARLPSTLASQCLQMPFVSVAGSFFPHLEHCGCLSLDSLESPVSVCLRVSRFLIFMYFLTRDDFVFIRYCYRFYLGHNARGNRFLLPRSSAGHQFLELVNDRLSPSLIGKITVD